MDGLELNNSKLIICAMELDNSRFSAVELDNSTFSALELDNFTCSRMELDSSIFRNFDDSKSNDKS